VVFFSVLPPASKCGAAAAESKPRNVSEGGLSARKSTKRAVFWGLSLVQPYVAAANFGLRMRFQTTDY
jgi:hypothetical protein